MANSFAVVDMVTREALRVAHETLAFIGTTDRQYDDSWKQTGAPKIGATLRVRKPNQYTRRTGSRVMDVQDQSEQTATITMATQDGVDMRFNSVELFQSVNNGAAFDDLSRNYISPAVKGLVSAIEADFLGYATRQTFNVAGTAGTGITTLATPGTARARMNQYLAPKDQRAIQLDSVTMGGLVNGVSGFFAPAAAIGEQYREGLIARTSMANYYENERVWTMVNGDDVAGAIDETADTNFTQGTTTLHMDGLGTTCYAGQYFTIAGMYACHPETKAAYSHLQQFVVAADVTLSGNEGDVTFSPAIYTTGARRNVGSATGAALTWNAATFNNAAVTFGGNASTSYVQGLMYHKEAFQFITGDLPLMANQQQCVRRVQDGLSMRVWMDSDIRNDELLMRIDILYGLAALRPEWACRLIGSAN